MDPVGGKSPVNRSIAGAKKSISKWWSSVVSAVKKSGGSPAAASMSDKTNYYELTEVAKKSVQSDSTSLDSGYSDSAIIQETVPEQAYLVGKGMPPEPDPGFPSQAELADTPEENIANYKALLDGGQRSGSLTIPRFDLSAVPDSATEVDIDRQINMLGGKEVTGEEFLKAIEHNPLIKKYTNQNLLTPPATEIFLRYNMMGAVNVGSGEGLIVNYYQNEEGHDCLEGVWLGRLHASGETLYEIDARMEVDLETKEATMSWKVREPVVIDTRRPYSVLHVTEGGQQLHYK